MRVSVAKTMQSKDKTFALLAVSHLPLLSYSLSESYRKTQRLSVGAKAFPVVFTCLLWLIWYVQEW